MKKVLSISIAVMVLAVHVAVFSAERKSALFVYNSSYDLTRGDLWEYIKDQQMLLDVESYPRNFVIIGLGNTNRSYSIGEMMAVGTVGLPKFLWIGPQYPSTVVEIWDREFPFAAMAVCNPKAVIQWDETESDIHKVLSDRIEAEGIKVAALKMRGTLRDVHFHVSSYIPKGGMDASQGVHGEGKRNKEFRIEGPSEWELNGFYFYSQELQLMASANGQPIRLHGYESTSKKGGFIDSARIDRLTVRVFPIEDIKLFQNDLLIENVKWSKGRFEITVVNDGRMNVKNVTVHALFPERETWSVTIDRIEPMSKRFIEFIPSVHLPEGRGWVVVDPNDEIKERREDNNRFPLPVGGGSSTEETHQ